MPCAIANSKIKFILLLLLISLMVLCLAFIKFKDPQKLKGSVYPRARLRFTKVYYPTFNFWQSFFYRKVVSLVLLTRATTAKLSRQALLLQPSCAVRGKHYQVQTLSHNYGTQLYHK